VIRGVAVAVAILAAVDILRRLWVRGRRLYSWTFILENVAVGAVIPIIFLDRPADALSEAIFSGIGWGIGAFFLDLLLWYSIDKKSLNEDRRES
jgi:hypothetical protein